ncbi:MAG: hypothetical protein M1839_009422 [Geoglossum umbratile]|nr:MAG: hypothetical protein M1839_009422 [Geoglossum umbratile]
MDNYDPDTDCMIIAKSPTEITAGSPTTIIAESPTTADIPILGAFGGSQTEGCTRIANPNEVPLSAVFEGAQTKGCKCITGPKKVPLLDPLGARRLNSKFHSLEGRLDRLQQITGSLRSTEPCIISRLVELEERFDDHEKRVNDLEKTIDGTRMQNNIPDLQGAKDKVSVHIDGESKELRVRFATKQGNISVSFSFP